MQVDYDMGKDVAELCRHKVNMNSFSPPAFQSKASVYFCSMRFSLMLLFQLLLCLFLPSKLGAQNNFPVPFQHIPTGKWGYKDASTGQVLFFWHFNAADTFNREGIARVTYRNRQSYMDTGGKLLLPLVFPFVSGPFGDTLYLNAQHTRFLAKSGQEFFEFKKRKNTSVQVSGLPVSEYYGKDLNVIRFHYPRDKDKFELMASEAGQKVAYPVMTHAARTEFKWSPTLFGQPLNNNDVPTPGRSHHLSITRFFQTKSGLEGFGLSTGFTNTKYWFDTAIYRQNQLTLGLVHRLNLTPGFYFDICVAPVVNQNVSRYDRKDKTWFAVNMPWTGIMAVYELSAGFTISRAFRLGLGYRHVPSTFEHPRLPRHFFALSFGLAVGSS